MEYTVWTLRITTSDARGAGMLDDCAGVQLALVARDGRTILRRLSPLYDSEAADSDLFEICRVRMLPCRCPPKSLSGCSAQILLSSVSDSLVQQRLLAVTFPVSMCSQCFLLLEAQASDRTPEHLLPSPPPAPPPV